MKRNSIFTCQLLLTTALIAQYLVAESAPRPNIIFCVTDDQGCGDVGNNDLKKIPRPNLDTVAAAGLCFDRFYATHSSCPPTRASVMTRRNRDYGGTPSAGMTLQEEERMFVQAVNTVGYAIAQFAKWHLSGGQVGMGWVLPTNRPLHSGHFGADEWFSVSHWLDTDWTFDSNGTPRNMPGDYSDAIVAKAIEFIEKKAVPKTPSFTVNWLGSPQIPLALTADNLAAAAVTAYYGKMIEVDRNVGALRKTVRKLGIGDNTLVYFNGDNGVWLDQKVGLCTYGSNGIFCGHKGELWEGGLRVPGMIEWPVRIKNSSVAQVPVCTSGLCPTIVDLSQIGISAKIKPLDGCSLVTLLEGKKISRPSPSGVWHHGESCFSAGSAAWSDDQYKVHHSRADKYDLYDLTKDIFEETDLASTPPKVVARMRIKLENRQHSGHQSISVDDGPKTKVITNEWKAADSPVYCDPEDDWAKDPSVIKVGEIYYMYYTSANPWQEEGAGGKGEPRIDYATSPDGIEWTHQGLAIPKGKAGEWDEERAQAPAKPILKNGIYYMYYAGKNAKSPVAIGYATSTDLRTWTKHPGNPVLNTNKCNDPFIFEEDDTYYLFHTSGGDGIRYVTSTDLLTWTDMPISTGAVGEGSIVIKDGPTYTMLGCIGFSGNGEYYETYTAQDLAKPFTDCGKTKINIPEFAKGSLCHGDIIQNGTDYWFYFQATRDGGRKFQIGLAKQPVP